MTIRMQPDDDAGIDSEESSITDDVNRYIDHSPPPQVTIVGRGYDLPDLSRPPRKKESPRKSG